jgi:hypothetical protein
LVLATAAGAATRYVNVNNAAPAPPYTTWATAATNIQDAVDAADAGEEILVTNGVYQTGARAVYRGPGAWPTISNRVAVTKPVTVRSVNGPANTIIRGYQVPGTTNGPAAVRCVYLTNGAVLAGFTLTNGATDYGPFASGGGVWCEGLSAVVSNCVLTGNSAFEGGGAAGGTLNHCTLTGNSASAGGGGASGGTLNYCTLTGNSASAWGGGASGGTLNNCVLSGNSADRGGGAYLGTLNNCTLTGNSADYGGGASGGTLNNCIVYYNRALMDGPNYLGSTLNYCCTTPLAAGPGNLDAEPQLASLSHLSADSPCRGVGSAAYVSGTDIDGEAWGNPPSMGCDEYRSGSLTGALSVAVVAADTNVAVGFAVDFQAVIGGRVSASRWDFGDGMVVSNRPWAAHAWAVAGDYLVEVRAYNESYPAGVAATVPVRVVPGEHYVALTSINPTPPYDSWATAATNIQDAVDAALPGGLVWVNDGVYLTGAREVDGMSNRVAVTKLVKVQSVNGPAVTQIKGYSVPGTTNGPAAVRCVYLTNGAVLAGFTLTNGATQTSGDYDRNRSGGGVWCEGPGAVVSNCVLTGNSAAWDGGGASGGTLNNCALTDNSAGGYGGAAYGAVVGLRPFGATLNNCTLTGNSAGSGGGASGGTLNHCTLTGNSASWGGGAYECTLTNCTLTGNSASWGGGAYVGTLTNCTLTGNSAEIYGGGASGGTLNHCTLTGNSARYGGGASYFYFTFAGGGIYLGATLTNCTLAGNSADSGGGAIGSTLTDCTLTGNSASWGGGAYDATLSHCTLAGNSASDSGGGAYDATLNNCAFTCNSAEHYGGGACYGTLNNCTLAGNSAAAGGGAYGGSLTNCIVYFNRTLFNGPNYLEGTLNYCCTSPLPPGPGNLTNAPLFVDTNGWSDLRLQATSPCVGAGNNAYASGSTDLAGNPRLVGGTVDMGAYESQPGWSAHPIFGWLWSAGDRWLGGSAYGWMWFDGGGQWIWSSSLGGWIAITDPNSRTLWSVQFLWLTPAADDAYVATTSSLGPIHVGVYHGALIPDGTPITDGWVVSDRFGYIWAAGDGVWFYSTIYGWLGVTPDGGIWCVDQARFL